MIMIVARRQSILVLVVLHKEIKKSSEVEKNKSWLVCAQEKEEHNGIYYYTQKTCMGFLLSLSLVIARRAKLQDTIGVASLKFFPLRYFSRAALHMFLDFSTKACAFDF